TAAASSPGPAAIASRPPTSIRPEISPPWKCGTRPQAARRRVVLPQPERPARTTSSPAPIRSETAARAGRSPFGYAEPTASNERAGVAGGAAARSATAPGGQAGEGDQQGEPDRRRVGVEAERRVGVEPAGAGGEPGDREHQHRGGEGVEAAVVSRAVA